MTHETTTRPALTLRPTVGVYAVDQHGRHWTTFTLIGGHRVRCVDCGAAVVGGWARALSDERRCVACVEVRGGTA